MSEWPLRVGLRPNIDGRARILILGSLPGEASLAAQHYAHPRNQFWRLLQDVIDQPLIAAPYPRRLAMLREAGIGLWDIVATGRRRASNDAQLVAETLQSVAELTRSLPRLQLIACNGGKAAALLARQFDMQIAQMILPSSSPANTCPYAEKLGYWLQLRAYL
jgi:double-stranded uracil-DNA glycosylase